MINRNRRQILRALGLMSAVSVFNSSKSPLYAADGSIATAEGVFDLGDFALECGTVLPNAKLVYKTHGRLNADKDNVILYPTQIGAQHNDIEWLIGPGKSLDPERYFVVVLDQLGNGLSSSPSNSPPPFDRARFPAINIRDDVTAHHRLVTKGFGIRRIALVVGYSMGAQQAYQWAVSHPELVDRIAPICGTAKTTPHNAVFLQSLRAALTTDGSWMSGDYHDQPALGMKALARVYAAWGLSQEFYKRELWRTMGFETLEGFVAGFWEKRYGRRDANNLLSMIRTWEQNDLGATPGMNGGVAQALASVKAKATIMASATDLYFTVEDMKSEAALVPKARFQVIPSLWGHMAGAGLNAADAEFIESELRALLAR
jgi:homoserine O-acetyltransferase